MFNPVRGSARETIRFEDAKSVSTVIADNRLKRPLYFDGRFLTARDMTREQTYFLARQADLGKAGGAGVVAGLNVTQGAGQATIGISRGQGVTAEGELVVLTQAASIDLSDAAELQRLNAAFGLLRIPNEPLRTRSGVFIVGLRPVEFSANPIASYPTTLSDRRSLQDGDIIEGAAITLVPYDDGGARTDYDTRRSIIARSIFTEGVTKGIPSGLLPLAMIALDRAILQWVDTNMVRREIGAEHGNILGLGFAPRALREAHLMQYLEQFQEVLDQRAHSGAGQRFAATDHFRALPSAGLMPSAAINSVDFTQIYFPPQVRVDLSIVPRDEVPALLEESLEMPPIDLEADGADLESTSILALVPVERGDLVALRSQLTDMTRAIRTAVPGLVAQRSPLESLRLLRVARPTAPVPPPTTVADGAWRNLLARTPLLWYARRRNLNVRLDAAGFASTVALDDTELKNRVNAAGWAAQFATLQAKLGAATFSGVAETAPLLARFSLLPLVLGAVIADLNALAKLDLAPVRAVAKTYKDKSLGNGVVRIEALNGDMKLAAVRTVLVASHRVVQLDTLGRKLTDAALAALLVNLATIAKAGAADAPQKVAAAIDAALKNA
ncbi:MAG: hypothetical protein JSU00_13780 [Acidobacteria bacterium]|nr:hypothetical protein [Acidobacteriota bacterium]